MDTPRRPTPPTRSRLRALGWMLLAGLWAWLGVLAASLAQVPGGARTAVVLTIDGAIGPASAD